MKILDHNVETGKIIERDATKEELAVAKETKASAVAEKTEAEAKAIAKAALLERLGITAEEASLLLA